MISKEIKVILTAGLLNGYLTNNTVREQRISSFKFQNTGYSSPEGVYEDRWIGKSSGGGQEVVKVNGIEYTRVYAGGCLEKEKLEKLGITKEDIDKFRKEALLELTDQTRLDDVASYQTGFWDYGYDIEDEFEGEFGVIQGMEQINYNEERVFLHRFLLCPVR
jgi:hypothetical protein